MQSEDYLLQLLSKEVDEDYAKGTVINQRNCPFIKYDKNQLSVKYVGKGLLYSDITSIQSNRPAQKDTLIYYYECKINNIGQRGDICIGFADIDFPMNKHPGWTRKIGSSYGYRADGKVYSGKEQAAELKKFLTGDVVGCGINYFKKEVFFTINGALQGTVFTEIEIRDFYATVGLHSPDEYITLNFGKKPFKFNIKEHIKQEKKTSIQQILQQDVHSNIMHQIVHSYLYYQGYFETLKEFEKSCKLKRENAFLMPNLENGGARGSLKTRKQQLQNQQQQYQLQSQQQQQQNSVNENTNPNTNSANYNNSTSSVNGAQQQKIEQINSDKLAEKLNNIKKMENNNEALLLQQQQQQQAQKQKQQQIDPMSFDIKNINSETSNCTTVMMIETEKNQKQSDLFEEEKNNNNNSSSNGNGKSPYLELSKKSQSVDIDIDIYHSKQQQQQQQQFQLTKNQSVDLDLLDQLNNNNNSSQTNSNSKQNKNNSNSNNNNFISNKELQILQQQQQIQQNNFMANSNSNNNNNNFQSRKMTDDIGLVHERFRSESFQQEFGTMYKKESIDMDMTLMREFSTNFEQNDNPYFNQMQDSSNGLRLIGNKSISNILHEQQQNGNNNNNLVNFSNYNGNNINGNGNNENKGLQQQVNNNSNNENNNNNTEIEIEQQSVNQYQQDLLEKYRGEVRQLIIKGDTDQVIKLIQNHYPGILEWKQKQIKSIIYYQTFIEMIRKDRISEGIQFVQDNLQLFEQKSFISLDKNGFQVPIEFEKVFGVISFQDLNHPEIQYLFDQKQRFLVSDIINQAILYDLGYSEVSILEQLIRQLIHVEERFKENNFYFGEIFKFKV